MRLTRVLLRFSATMESTLIQTEKEINIKAPWGNIAGLTWGHQNKPPVFLCHGKLDGCSTFRPLVSLLPDSFFYVTIDLPGNGKSDHLPKGVLYSIVDLVPTFARVVKHFEWKNFMYIGWSLGVAVGKIFDIAYPGAITRMVELDPVPAYHNWPHSRQGLKDWYHYYYSYYDDGKYYKSNSGPETAPKYTYEKAKDVLIKARGLTEEAAKHAIERIITPAGDGLYRFTFDQRMKGIPVLPYSGELLANIYTTTNTPILGIIASQTLAEGVYDNIPFMTNPNLWPNKNYTYKVVEGGHDVHINTPEAMADDISKFLMEEFKSKL